MGGLKSKIGVGDAADDGDAEERITPMTKRHCTDILCLLVFATGWVAYVVVTVAGLSSGDPAKLYTPRDYSGAYCGFKENWNNRLNLEGQTKLTYVMNVSAMTDQIAKQLLCSSATSNFLLGANSPLNASEQSIYSCACCLGPCVTCSGSLDLGKGGNLASQTALSSTVTARMGEMTSVSDNGRSLFDPAGFNGDFASKVWGKATEYLIPVCLPSCNTDTGSAATSGRSYTYAPSADNPLRVAWDRMSGSGSNAAAGPLPAMMRSNTFTFPALPSNLCPYADVYCVPFPGLKLEELAADYCKIGMSATVVSAVGKTAADTFANLGGNSFANVTVETFGTYMGDFERSIDSFVIVALLSFVVGLIFLVLLRFFVGVCVWTTIILVLLLLLVGGGIVWARSSQCAGAGLFDTTKQMATAVTVAGTSAASNAITGTQAPSEELVGDGRTYIGVQTRTRSGYLCKNWDQSPYASHVATFNLRQNFCRNPYNNFLPAASTIWCYTTDADKAWELCSPIGVIQPQCNQGFAVTSETGRTLLKVCAVIIWILALIWLVIILCFCSRIRLAVALNKVGAQFLAHTPHVVLVPAVQAICGVAWGLLWTFSACFLLSQVPDGFTPTSSYATYTAAAGTHDATGACTDKWPTGFAYRDETCTLADPKCWKCGQPRYIFDIRFFISLFMYLWNTAFIIALGQCCMAGAVGIWFFTANHEKGKVACVWGSVKMCFRYHTGSMAFGSLILAIVQFIRYVLMYFKKQAEVQKNRVMACILRVTGYLLWCLERFIEFLNKNAYIQIALRGTNFCTSAKNAFKIITSNPLRFGAVLLLGKVVHWVGVLFIVASTATLGWFIQKGMHPEANPVVPMILYVVVGYIVGKLFMSVFQMSVDTSLQCFIQVEESGHDGTFVPSVLEAILPAKTSRGKGPAKEGIRSVHSQES